MAGQIVSVLVLLATLSSTASDDEEKPDALVRAQQARTSKRLATARLELVTRAHDSRDFKHIWTRYATWKCAQDRYILIDRGDEHGIFHLDQDGQPTNYTRNGPDSWFVKDGEAFRHQEETLGADVFSKGDAMTTLWDVRTSGLGVSARDDDEFEADCAAHGMKIQWSSRLEDGLHVVTGKLDDNSVEWWIDPTKDWGVVKTMVYLTGNRRGETRYELAKLDGVWFPRKTEFFRHGDGNATEPSLVVEVVHAEFNRADHPQELTPADIGIEVGMTMSRYERQAPHVSLGYWDGKKSVSLDEYRARLATGELVAGPTIQRRADHLRAQRSAQETGDRAGSEPRAERPALPKSRVESEWEAYTRRFIDAHQLDKEQTTRALSILKACQDRAWEYVSKHAAEFDEVERLADKTVAEKPAADGRPATQPARELEARRTRLLQPIIAIFDDELKPRLDRLPTRAQHEAARQRGWVDSSPPGAKQP